MLQWALPFTMGSAGALLVTSFILASLGRKLRPGEQPIERTEMSKYLLWGIAYCNPDDPRGWVPKYWGPGWTVNVRNRTGATFVLIFTIMTVVGVVLSVGAAFGVLRA
jgi:uncharacterized membrane protein